MIGRTPKSSTFDVGRVVQAKAGRSVAAVLPARNEEDTIGPIVEVIRSRLMDPSNGIVVDELVVMDDQSTDRTAENARTAGARVVSTTDLATEIAPGPGKGEALWKSLLATQADIVCWCDADVADFDGSYILGLVGALCEDERAVLAKGHYERTGGRVTELVARPVISLLHSELSHLPQPLSGEIAIKRSAAVSLPFCRGYAVDLGLLIDVAAAHGVDRILPVDLGVRHHDPQDLAALGAQATAIMSMLLRRAGLRVPTTTTLHQPAGQRVVATRDDDLPPLLRFGA